MNDTLKKIQSKHQSGFSHYCASWARNHNGWAKQKQMNHKAALAKDRRQAKQEIESERI